jgi:hypothetical protein
MRHPLPSLPAEIRVRIYNFALTAEQPRKVEVFVNEAGELYSPTPPALLHVCSESRRVTLKRHKPWLPQFNNHSGYERFHYLIEEHGIEGLSKLQRVWVDFQGDELILNGSLHDLLCLLGPVDERFLTSVGLQIHTITTNLNLRFLWADDYDATSAPYLYVLQLRKLHSLRTFSVINSMREGLRYLAMPRIYKICKSG